MEQFLIDTNVVSYYLSASLPPAGMAFLDAVIDAIPKLSIITQIELLCWKSDAATEKEVKHFIEDSNILNIESTIIEFCVTLRKGRKIKTPDAIIAATAIAYGYTLITNNEKDFLNIKGLKTINPLRL